MESRSERRVFIIPPDRVERVEGASAYDAEAALRLVELLAGAMDDGVRLPGTALKIPLDPVIGLIPVVGDAITTVVSGIILKKAHELGVSKTTLLRMLLNIGVDAVVGIVPVVGDLFDLGFKSNRRNLRLLRRDLEKKKKA